MVTFFASQRRPTGADSQVHPRGSVFAHWVQHAGVLAIARTFANLVVT